MSEYSKPYRSLVPLIPTNIQNPVNTSLLGNLFDKNLTYEEAVKFFGMIGKYFPARKDYRPWLSHSSLERDFNQLAPMLVAKHGTDEFIFSFADMLNKAKILGIDEVTMSDWLSSQAFNFAPPIDVDKFVNFSSYYWVQSAIVNEATFWNPSESPEYYVIAKPKINDKKKLPVSLATTGPIALNGTLEPVQTWYVEFINATTFTVAGSISDLVDTSNDVNYVGANLAFTVEHGNTPFATGDTFTINLQQLSTLPAIISYSGSGNGTLTGTTGTLPFGSIDGIQIEPGLRILVKDQIDQSENGIYEVRAASWVRTFDCGIGYMLNGIEVFVRQGLSNIGTWESVDGYATYTQSTITSNLSEWEMNNYWVHVDDLHQYGLTASGAVERAIRPIIEFNSGLDKTIGQLKTRFNQIPLFNLYWPLDGTKAPWISGIFYYAEDIEMPLDIHLQRRVKADKSGNFYFEQGLKSPDGKVLAFKLNDKIESIWAPGPSIAEKLIAIPTHDGTGTGSLVNIEVDQWLDSQTWTLTAIEDAVGSINTSTFKVVGSRVGQLSNALVGVPYTDSGNLSFLIVENATSFKLGDTFIFISGIEASQFTNQENWILAFNDSTSFSVSGAKAGVLEPAIIGQQYVSDFITFNLDQPEIPFGPGMSFEFKISGAEAPRYAYKGDDGLPKTYVGYPGTDVNIEGCWLTPPQLIHNVELENRSQLLFGDLVDHYTSIIESQQGIVGSSFGINNFRRLTSDIGLGGTVKSLMGNSNLFWAMLNQQDMSAISIIDFAEQQYSIALNSLTDYLITLLPEALRDTVSLDINNIFNEYSKNYIQKSAALNVFGTSTSPISNWPLTLPLMGMKVPVIPEVKFDLDLGLYVLVHHDGHQSPIIAKDLTFEHNLALSFVQRYDGHNTPGSATYSEPSNPYKGQLWFDTSINTLKFFQVDYEGEDLPVEPLNGQSWYNRISNELKIFNLSTLTWDISTAPLTWIAFEFEVLANNLMLYAENILYNEALKLRAFEQTLHWDSTLPQYQDVDNLQYELAKFAVANKYDPFGTEYEPSDAFSWNYHLADFSAYGLTGPNLARWHVIYRTYFSQFIQPGIELTRPDIEPWKLLGHISKPGSWTYDWAYSPALLDNAIQKAELTLVATEEQSLINVSSGINGIIPLNGDTVLLTAQNDSTQNGVYIYNGIELIRHSMFLSASDYSTSYYFTILKGIYVGSHWIVSQVPSILDSDPLIINQIRNWNPQLWTDIVSLHPSIKLCVNPYTDLLLPPYVANSTEIKIQIPSYNWQAFTNLGYTLEIAQILEIVEESIVIDGITAQVKVYKEVNESEYSVASITNSFIEIIFNDSLARTGMIVVRPANQALLFELPSGVSDRYEFGDEGPVEQVWRHSISFNYAQVKSSFKINPVEFLSKTWGFQSFNVNALTLDRITGKLQTHTDFTLHGDKHIRTLETQPLTVITNAVITKNVSMILKVIYQQPNGDMLLCDTTNALYYIANTSVSVTIPSLGITLLDFSIKENGNPLILGDAFEFNLDFDTGINTITFIPVQTVKYQGLNQLYTQLLSFASIDTAISQNVALLKNWEAKLGYRTGTLIENDNFKIISDNFGEIPESSYRIALNKSNLAQDFWLQALRVQILQIGNDSKILGKNAEDEIIYVPTNKGEDWVFRIENYFSRNPQIDTYEFDTTSSGMYETFNAMSKAHSADEWINYQTPLHYKTVTFPINITGIQNVVTFLHAYATYIADLGFAFAQGDEPSVDASTGRLKDWQFEIERFIDKLYIGTKQNAGFAINPFIEKFWLYTPTGLPASLKQRRIDDVLTSQFVFDILGDVVPAKATTIIRFDDHSEFIGGVPMFGAHIAIDEYEHIVLFNDYIENKNGLFFDGFLGLIAEKLQISGRAKKENNFRPTFGGFFLTDGNFKKNMNESVDGVSDYYNTNTMFDNSDTTNHALALLGFSKKDYFNLLKVNEKTEFNFWRGMITAKGTNYSTDAFLNSIKFEYAKLDEFWAYKIAEYGDARTVVYPELKINSSDCLLTHTRFYFEDITGETPLSSTFISISPTDEDRWFSLVDLNTNLYFEPEVSQIKTYNVLTPNQLVVLPPSDAYNIISKPLGAEITPITQTVVECTEVGTYELEFLTPAKPKFSPIKLFDYVEKALIEDITTWHPAFGNHSALAMEVVNVISQYNPARYNYSILTQNNRNYDPQRAWGEREVGRTWWDVTHLDYIPYFDHHLFPNIEERLARWGSLAEYAKINLYEWVKSDLPPSEYDAQSVLDQLSADVSIENKKTGSVARKKSYTRTRSWQARTVAWMKSENFVAPTTQIFLSSSDIGPTTVILDNGRFDQYGIANGMKITGWNSNKPIGELVITSNPKYTIGTYADRGGDLVVFGSDAIGYFDMFQVTWSNNKNFIGKAIGNIDIEVGQLGIDYFIRAIERASGISFTHPIYDFNGLEGSIIEFDFNQLGIKLICTTAQSSLTADEIAFALGEYDLFDIVLRTYVDADILIPFYTTISDDILGQFGTTSETPNPITALDNNISDDTLGQFGTTSETPNPITALDNNLSSSTPLSYGEDLIFASNIEMLYLDGITIKILFTPDKDTIIANAGIYKIQSVQTEITPYIPAIPATGTDPEIPAVPATYEYHLQLLKDNIPVGSPLLITNITSETPYHFGNILSLTITPNVNYLNANNVTNITASQITTDIHEVCTAIKIEWNSDVQKYSIQDISNYVPDFQWNAWTEPTQDDLDIDLPYPSNTWTPVYGDWVNIPSTRDTIDRIVAYNAAPLILNTGEEVKKFNSIWGEWSLLEQDFQQKYGTGIPLTFYMKSKVKSNQFSLYINGISQFTNSYSINKLDEFQVSTNKSIPAGHLVTAVLLAYEPTQKDLSFNPDVLDDPSIQVQYKSDYEYVTKSIRDAAGNITGNTYYFWVKDKSIANMNKKLSTQQAARLLLEGPSTYLTFQELKNESTILTDGNTIPPRYRGITIGGLNLLANKDNTFKLRFTRDFTLRDDPKDLDLKNSHAEWILLRPNQKDKIPVLIWNKLVDSACGKNSVNQAVPSLNRILYDERHGTATKYGFGIDQVLADRNLIIATLTNTILNPTASVYRNGINTIVPIAGIDMSQSSNWFNTAESTRQLLDFIWRTALPQQINELFFEVLNDAYANNYEFSDIFKTSRVSAHSIMTIKPEYKVNDADVYY